MSLLVVSNVQNSTFLALVLNHSIFDLISQINLFNQFLSLLSGKEISVMKLEQLTSLPNYVIPETFAQRSLDYSLFKIKQQYPQ